MVAVVAACLSAPFAADEATAAAPNLTAAVARVSTLPDGRAGMVAEYDPASDAVFLLGGYGAACGTTCTGKTLTADVLRYDPYVDRFDPAPPLTDQNGDPLHLALAAHANVPGHGIYLFGGVEATGPDRDAACGGACTVTQAVRRYDPATGTTTTLSATLPTAVDRATAVYDPDTGRVYVVGGVTSDDGFGAALHQLLAFDPATEQFVGSPVTLPAHGYYLAAGYVPYTRAQGDPFVDPQYVHPGPQDRGFVELLASEGLVEYYPTSPDVPNYYDFAIQHQVLVGSSWAYEAGKEAIVSAGGLCGSGTSCPSSYDDAATARGPNTNETVAGLLPIGSSSAPGDLDAHSQLDGAAAYIPSLDRVISFGGFMGTMPAAWTNSPNGPQFRDVVYSLSPTYPSSLAPGPVPIDSPALVAGQSATVQVRLDDPSRPFALGLQTSFASVGQPDQVETRAIPFTTAGTGDPNVMAATFTVPKDISPGPDEHAAGVCAIALDSTGPQNCREVVLTTNPGTLDVDVLGHAPNATAQPLTRAVVRLIDRDGHQVDQRELGSATQYTNPGLASGAYTLQVWRPFAHGDRVLYLPRTTLVTVRAGHTTAATVTLSGTSTLGPVATSVTASHDATPGPAVGTFLAFPAGAAYAPAVPETFTVNGLVEPWADPLDGGYHTARVDFAINGAMESDTNGTNGWSATFDLSQVLQPGANTLHVTATDTGSHVGPSYDLRILAIAAKPFSHTFNPSVSWDPDQEAYTAQFIVPGQPRLRYPDNPPAVTNLLLFKLYSQLRADAQLTERYSIDGRWQASGDGAVLAQFLSTAPDRYNLAYPFTVVPRYAPDGSVDSYTMTTDIDVCHALQSAESDVSRTVSYMRRLTDPTAYLTAQSSLFPCNQWLTVFGGDIVNWPGVAKLRVSVDLKLGAHFVMQGTIDGRNYGVRGIRVAPTPDAALRLAAELDLLSGTVSGGAWASADLFAQEPIVYATTHNPPLYLDSPCLRLLVTGGAWIETPLGRSTYGPKAFDDEQHPSGCFTTASPNARTAAARVAGAGFVAPRVMPEPVTATDPAPGGSTVRLWVEDADPTGVPVPRLHVDAAGTTSTLGGSGGQSDPGVAFTGVHHAIAAWTQTTLTKTQAATMTAVQIARHEEIEVAMWNGTTWSTPVALTRNTRSDGRVAVSSPGDGTAVVAWVQDSDGDPATKGDWRIMTRRWSGTAWLTATAFGSGDGAADLEPALASSSTGSTWLVWTHDADADFTTNTDRHLDYAVYSPGTSSWSAAVQPPWPAGALTPSLVFSPMSDRPLVVMSVMSKLARAPGATSAKPAGVGTEGLLYAAWGAPDLTPDGWDVQQIGNTDPGSRTDDPRGEWPEAMLLPGSDNVALVVARTFGGDGTAPNSGRASAVEANLGAGSARWATPGSLTTGPAMAWQLDASGGGPGEQTPLDLVGVTSAAPSQTVARQAAPEPAVQGAATRMLAASSSGSVFQLSANTTGTDLGISSLVVSDPAPAPGEDVTATVHVTNPDLQPVSTARGGTPSFDVDLYRIQDTCPGPAERTDFGRVGTQTVTQDVLFHEDVPVQFHVTATGAPEHVLACLYFDAETSLGPANNAATVSLGALMQVLGVKAARLPQGPVAVQWLAQSTSPSDPVVYRVFRSTSAAGPWTLAATTSGTAVTDVAPGTATRYRVEAYDARGFASPPGTAVAPTPVATHLTTTGKRAGGTDVVRGGLTPADPNGSVRATLFVKRNGAFVRVGAKNGTLGAATDPDGDGVPTSSYSVTFNRPSGTTCKVIARYGGDSRHLASTASGTFRC